MLVSTSERLRMMYQSLKHTSNFFGTYSSFICSLYFSFLNPCSCEASQSDSVSLNCIFHLPLVVIICIDISFTNVESYFGKKKV
jgi:hypothetical protein